MSCLPLAIVKESKNELYFYFRLLSSRFLVTSFLDEQIITSTYLFLFLLLYFDLGGNSEARERERSVTAHRPIHRSP